MGLLQLLKQMQRNVTDMAGQPCVRKPQSVLEGIIPYDPKYLPADVMISANENPCPVPEAVQAQIAQAVAGVSMNRYPDPLANKLRTKIAQAWGYSKEYVLLGNGGDELLFNIALAWGGPGRTMLTTPPTFSVYEANATLTQTKVVAIKRKEDFSLDEAAILARVAQGDIDYVTITSPNNPTGNCASIDFLKTLLEATDALVMVDEAYGEFGGESIIPLLDSYKNLVVLKTFSKAYSLAGVRLGYIMANPEVIQEFIKVRQPYSVDAISQTIGEVVYENRALLQPQIDEIITQRSVLTEQLANLPGVEVFPSEANFILVRLPQADAVWQQLFDSGILVRDFSHSAGLEGCLRITVGTEAENTRLITTLRHILSEQSS
jgi:histidinol-phosphate aminotransferase